MSNLLNPGAAAAKNNENQQEEAVNNSQQAWKNAATNFNNFLGLNPSPVNGLNVAAPAAPTPGSIANQILSYHPMQSPVQRPPMPAAPKALPATPPINQNTVGQILGE